jgi:hypothetical protein
MSYPATTRDEPRLAGLRVRVTGSMGPGAVPAAHAGGFRLYSAHATIESDVGTESEKLI